jgi:hypothetical protein
MASGSAVKKAQRQKPVDAVCNLIAHRLEDASELLGRLGTSGDFH